MSDYYAALASHPDPSRRVGWESRLAQLTRFATVAASLNPDDRLLDVGAGLGDLARALAFTHPAVQYVGLEARAAFVAEAARMSPPVSLRLGRFGEETSAPPTVDVAVAVGALVDGRPLDVDGVRLGRVRALLAQLLDRARRHVIAIFASQEALEADPLRAADEALGGLRQAEVAWVEPEGATFSVRADILPSDLVVTLARSSSLLPALPPSAALRDAARAHPMAPRSTLEALRFALLTGELDRAEALVSAGLADGAQHDPAWRLLEARLRLLASHRT